MNAVPSCSDRMHGEDDRQDSCRFVLYVKQPSDLIGSPFWAFSLADTISAIKTASNGAALLITCWNLTKAFGRLC